MRQNFRFVTIVVTLAVVASGCFRSTAYCQESTATIVNSVIGRWIDGTSTYIGMMPERKLGVIVMANRGKCQGTAVGRRLLLQLAGITPLASSGRAP